MDALSDVLHVLRLSGAVFLAAEFTEPWCISTSSGRNVLAGGESEHTVFFHWLISGRCKARLVEGGETLDIGPGDLLMMPNDESHMMGSDLDITPVVADTLVIPEPEGGMLRINSGGGGEKTHFVCGFLACDRRLSRPVLEGLPNIMRVPFGADPASTWLKSLLDLGKQETLSRRPGSDTVLAKLSELLFVEAVRRYSEGMPTEQKGWLAGLRDRFVGKALALLHEQPARDWTIDELGHRVGLSRSALHERFVQLLGVAPMQYLAQWRMQTAARLLLETRSTVAAIALDVGYDSEAAFARAFKRVVGKPPASWRREREGDAD